MLPPGSLRVRESKKDVRTRPYSPPSFLFLPISLLLFCGKASPSSLLLGGTIFARIWYPLNPVKGKFVIRTNQKNYGRTVCSGSASELLFWCSYLLL